MANMLLALGLAVLNLYVGFLTNSRFSFFVAGFCICSAYVQTLMMHDS